MSSILEIEVAGPRNENLRFRPIQKDVRGRFDWGLVAEPEAHRASVQWAGGIQIPGQRIGYDEATGKGYIVDPLHSAEHKALAEKIVAKGYMLPPAREEFVGDKTTWLYWLRQAVVCGLARIVAGKLPDELDETKVRRDFIFAPRQPSTADKMTAAMNRQADAFDRLAAALEKSLLKK